METLLKNRTLSYLRQQTCQNQQFRFIDLFAGIGGMRQGFEHIGGQCVFTSEWDKFARQTYQANYNCDHELAGDITQIDAQDIPSHDVLLAGFPCQPFSLAGVSKKNSLGKPHGFADQTQGTLFYDVARIIEQHQPRAFLLENVKNLKSHDKGRTFKIIMDVLQNQLGYQVSHRIIDARSFVPQHRERIFIAGFRDNVDFNLESISLPDPDQGPRLGSILHRSDSSEPPGQYTDGPFASPRSKYTLSDRLWECLQKHAAKHRANGNGFGYGLVTEDDITRTLLARYHKDGSEILLQQPDGLNPRRLTPRECSRLMGFDSPQGADFNIPVSDTQAYRQFGNSVVVPVVKAVAEAMLPWITLQDYFSTGKHPV